MFFASSLNYKKKKKIRDGSEKKLNTSHTLQFSNFYAS